MSWPASIFQISHRRALAIACVFGFVESPFLLEELQAAGWKRYRKVFSPKQVAIIIEHLGEPEQAAAKFSG